MVQPVFLKETGYRWDTSTIRGNRSMAYIKKKRAVAFLSYTTKVFLNKASFSYSQVCTKKKKKKKSEQQTPKS